MRMARNRNPDTWIAYVACCFVAMFDFPLTLTFGALYINLLDKYGETRSNTAVVQSVFIGCSSIASTRLDGFSGILTLGVVSGALIRRFGAGRMSFLGSTLLPVGFIFSFFASSVFTLVILIGVIAGLGTCLLFVSSTVVAGSLFEGPMQEIALSIHNVIIGLGSIIYPYILNSLSNRYGVNGTFLILGALLLNNVVVALLIFFKELRTYKVRGRRSQKHIKKLDSSSNTETNIGNTKSIPDIDERSSKSENVPYLKETKIDKTNTQPLSLDTDGVFKITNETGTVDKKSNISQPNNAFDKNSRSHLKEAITKRKTIAIESPRKFTNKTSIRTSLKARFAQLMNVRLILIILATSFVGTAFSSYLVVFEDVLISKGISHNDLQNQFLAFNLACLFSRALPIIFSKFNPGSDFVELLIFGSLSGCIGQLFILLSSKAVLLYLGNFLSGFALGSTLSAGTVALLNITTTHLFGVAFGLFVTLEGVEAMVLGPLYGFIRDTTSSYEGAIVLTAVLNATSALMCMLLKLVKHFKTKKKENPTTDPSVDSSDQSATHYGIMT